MDGTENQKDTSEATQDTSAGQKGTSKEETPTLTETQAKERTTKAVSDALATAGRTAKGFEGREATVKAREEAAEARQKVLDDAELEAIKGDPDLETQYRRKQEQATKERALVADRQKLEQEKTQHKADIDAANASKKEIVIKEIALKYGVDANALKELNLDTPEQIEATAKAIAAGKPATPGGEPDSLKTKGGAGDLSGLSPLERKKERERIAYKTK